jgi:hypothetical protein
MLLRFRKWLALWLYPVDVLDLTREQLKLIDTNVPFYEELNPEAQERLAANANNIFKNPAFIQVIQYLTRCQEQFTSREAPAWESVLIGRGTINGLDLVRQEFEKLASIHEDKQRVERFNKHDVM